MNHSMIFQDMFGTAAMRAVFDDAALVARYVQVEVALARAQARAGEIPATHLVPPGMRGYSSPDGPPQNVAEARQSVVLKHGIDQESGKKVNKLIKDSKIKVTSQIQGDKVRVTGKSRDDLQAVMALLRREDVGVPLQFENFRD